MSNTLWIAYTENDLTRGVLQNTQLGYWFPFRFLVGLYNSAQIIKIYVINHSTFSRYLERGTTTSLHPFRHEQYLSDNIGQKE
jgi:hypothetical protein